MNQTSPNKNYSSDLPEGNPASGELAPIVSAQNVGRDVTGPNGVLTILDNIHLDITRSERVAIVGVSGSGKSTLLGLLAGLDVPTRGQITLDGVSLNALDEDGRAAVRAGRVGFIFQDFQLLRSMTALENVTLPLEMTNGQVSNGSLNGPLDHATIRARAEHRLAEVGLADRMHHYPAQLSGGEQQRVAIARAFAADPAVLFADEPTGNLDRATALQIVDLLISLNETSGTTTVIVTHDLQLAERCHRSVVLEGGQIVNGAVKGTGQ